MLVDASVEPLRQRYAHVHPLIFHKSVEKAKTLGDLFDILETLPLDFPIAWNEEDHCWRVVERFPARVT